MLAKPRQRTAAARSTGLLAMVMGVALFAVGCGNNDGQTGETSQATSAAEDPVAVAQTRRGRRRGRGECRRGRARVRPRGLLRRGQGLRRDARSLRAGVHRSQRDRRRRADPRCGPRRTARRGRRGGRRRRDRERRSHRRAAGARRCPGGAGRRGRERVEPSVSSTAEPRSRRPRSSRRRRSSASSWPRTTSPAPRGESTPTPRSSTRERPTTRPRSRSRSPGCNCSTTPGACPRSGSPMPSRSSPPTRRRSRPTSQRAGYDPGPIDGVYGPQTIAAVEAAADRQWAPVTGFVDEATARALQDKLDAVGQQAATGGHADDGAPDDPHADRLLGRPDRRSVDGRADAGVDGFQTALGVEPTGRSTRRRSPPSSRRSPPGTSTSPR